MAVISLGMGFLLSKIFFSSERASSQNYKVGKKLKLIVKNGDLKEFKPDKIEFKKMDEKKEITETILKSSDFFQKDPVERDIALDRTQVLIQGNPEDSFLAIKNILDKDILDGDPILKGSLLVQAAFIKGKETKVREMALGAIFSENIPKEKELNELLTEEELNKEYSDDPKIIGMAQYYDAFLATTINDEDQVFNKSLEIIEAHPNIKVQRLVAKKYLETFPSNGPVFWEFLKNRNIYLIPRGRKFTINGIVYQ